MAGKRDLRLRLNGNLQGLSNAIKALKHAGQGTSARQAIATITDFVWSKSSKSIAAGQTPAGTPWPLAHEKSRAFIALRWMVGTLVKDEAAGVVTTTAPQYANVHQYGAGKTLTKAALARSQKYYAKTGKMSRRLKAHFAKRKIPARLMLPIGQLPKGWRATATKAMFQDMAAQLIELGLPVTGPSRPSRKAVS